MTDEIFDDWRELEVTRQNRKAHAVPTSELVDEWRDATRGELPRYVYRVTGSISFDDLAVWKVELLKRVEPEWARRSKSKFAVVYRGIECVWHGPKAAAKTPEEFHQKSKQYISSFDSFDQTLEDAGRRLQGFVDKYRESATERAEHYAEESKRYAEWSEREREKVDRLNAFDVGRVLGVETNAG